MQTLSTSLKLAFVLLIALGLVAGLTYWAATRAIQPAGPSVQAAYALTPVTYLNGTPVVRYARVNPSIVSVLEYAAPYSDYALTVPQAGVVAVGAYLPRTGNTQFEFIDATPLPTPIPYPTSPPLPLPALPESVQPTAIAQATLDAQMLIPGLPTMTSVPLPAVGAVCAPSGYPVDGVLTQRFHAYHSGMDIGVPLGTPVLATMSGVVTFAGWSEIGYGNLVIVQNQQFITYYAHNTSFNVTLNQYVAKGSIVSYSGSTGNSTGPHVHYETRINDVPVDPMTFEDRGYATC
jgi:murein DD-endopeptidase MepM/ murein hydrolase activator NlpD